MSFFCIKPWNEMMILDDAVVPCCHYGPPLKMSVKEYLNSTELATMKQQLLDGEVPPGCIKCALNEQRTGHSDRIIDLKFHPEIVEQIHNGTKDEKLGILSVRTSNVCNLKCLPCSFSSHVRALELKKLNLIPQQIKIEKHRVKDVDLSPVTFEKLILIGGEPFYDRVSFEILDQLVTENRSKDIVVEFNTNGTHVTQKKLDFLSSNFRQVSLKFSIDGVGAINDYLRYPSKWDNIERNIDYAMQYENVSTMVVGAISNLALLRWYEVIQWAHDKNIQDVFLSVVNTPALMNINRLPGELKQSLIEPYQRLLQLNNLSGRMEYCINTLLDVCKDQYDIDMTPTFKWLEPQDQLRGNSVFNVFPELIPYAKT